MEPILYFTGPTSFYSLSLVIWIFNHTSVPSTSWVYLQSATIIKVRYSDPSFLYAILSGSTTVIAFYHSSASTAMLTHTSLYLLRAS
jgi:hypothetical protein